jgi:rSAM/selenodomain-associated transferase 2
LAVQQLYEQWSVVIPVLNEQEQLGGLLAQLADVEDVWVVDGGSGDRSRELALLMGAKLLRSAPSRGGQLAAGAAQARNPRLFFVHADARLPAAWQRHLSEALGRSAAVAAALRLKVKGRGWRLRLLERLVGLRSRWLGLPYGDQGLALSSNTYWQLGGYRALPLMEDLDLVQRLGRRGRVVLATAAIEVNDRRWRRLGVWRTAWRNAQLRAAWRRGEDAEQLASRYRAN